MTGGYPLVLRQDEENIEPTEGEVMSSSTDLVYKPTNSGSTTEAMAARRPFTITYLLSEITLIGQLCTELGDVTASGQKCTTS